MKKIIFRADGNAETGLGHMYRAFALLEMYLDNFDCLLITKENSTTAVIPGHYNYRTIPAGIGIKQEPEWLNENYTAAETWLFADGYHFTSPYQKAIKDLGFKLAYVDDLCAWHMYADVVINHAINITADHYTAQPYTKFALGTGFAILRPLFIAAAANTARNVGNAGTALVCFGGADPLNLTFKAAQALCNLKSIHKINVIVGGAYKHREIFELGKTHPQLKIHQNIAEAELVAVMKNCDFGIAPASNILYELCAVKMPVLSGYYVENQKHIHKGALEKQIIFDGGDFEAYTIADFENKITAMLAAGNNDALIKNQAALFDGRIKERFLNLLMETTYRKATPDDMLLVFNWANDQLSRANSYFSEPIALETHKAWFKKKLQDKHALIYIAEVGQMPAGMVRYDISDNDATVGILVAEDFRGKGLAADFLTGTAQLYFKENTKPVLAYIKEENTASIRSFEKAKYKKLKNELVHGCKSHVYKLEEHDV